MEFDVVVRGGMVVDGTGSAPFTADIGVSQGRILEVGRITAGTSREIDADGATVTPGFVDIHTHYDGQATWDSRLQPSSWHGVTTAVMGNCGVGFAPVRRSDHDRLIDLMEGVEDIPGVALHEGLSWEWESFPQYLDALQSLPHDMDLGTQVPHAALRVYAMGSRATARAVATEDEVNVMARSLQEAISSGALGFSTSRSLNHKSVTGEITPTHDVADDELIALAAVLRREGTGVLQLIPDATDPETDFQLIRSMLQASGRPMSVSLLQGVDNPDHYKKVLSLLTAVNAEGHELRAQVAPRAIGVILGLQCTLHPFMVNPEWKAISHLPPAEQARRMSDPAVRAQILARQTDEHDTAHAGGRRIHYWHTMYELTDPPRYEPDPSASIAALAARTGRSPEEIAYDLVVADQGRGLIYMAIGNYSGGSLDTVREMLTHEFTLPGLSDGGAHVGTICDASFPTTLLEYWARERPHDRIDLPFLVKRQARDTARAVGLHDRGVLQRGYRADLNVIDPESIRLHKPEISNDLPAGGKRFLQRADGYWHTLVNGIETYASGQATGELPGRLIRGAQPAPR
jgi:N-acyl-D-aspartate/D-glutamate deacylase